MLKNNSAGGWSVLLLLLSGKYLKKKQRRFSDLSGLVLQVSSVLTQFIKPSLYLFETALLVLTSFRHILFVCR